MVARNGNLPESDVGFYSGLIESMFSATQMVVLIFWGILADRVGRKPILIYSLIGMAIGPVLFGMASSIWQMILFRCLAGLFSGSSLIIRTMIGDHTTPETQAVAFSWFAFAGNIGIFLGPLIGGLLADPASQYPGVFGGIKFFVDYPYALPGFVIGAISVTAAITSALFLEETLTKKDPSSSSSSNGTQQPEEAPENTTTWLLMIWQLIKAPDVGIVLWTFGHVMALGFAFTAIMPISLFTPVKLGGIGFSSFQISMYMAANGGSQALWLLLIFPLLHRRMGTKGILRMCAAGWPVFFVGYIAMNALLRQGSEAAMVWFWIVGSIVAFVGPGVAMAFTAVQLALNDASPTPNLLGSLNALAMTNLSAIRSVVPGVATAVYAVGVRNQIFAGQFAFVLLIPVAMALSVVLRWLPDGRK